MQLLQVFHLSTMKEVIRIRFSSFSAVFFFCRKSQTIVSFYVCKSMLFRGENFNLIFCCWNYFYNRLQDLYICYILHLFSINISDYKDSPKVFANWFCMYISFTCIVGLKHECLFFRLQCAKCYVTLLKVVDLAMLHVHVKMYLQ